MTARSASRCRQVEADLFAGPGDPAQARRVASHLAGCDRCRGLSRRLTQDREGLGSYLDGADWLPVASDVLAALPDRTRQPVTSPTGGSATGRGDQSRLPGRRPGIGRSHARSGRVATALRAACLVLVGLGLGLALPQAWPGGGDRPAGSTEIAAPGGQAGALGAEPGTSELATTDSGSVSIPGPGGNPPLVVPGGTGGINASQDRATWSAIRATVPDATGVLLHPPVPPGLFDSVVIETLAPGTFAVRYATEDMSFVITAGPVAEEPTVPPSGPADATVRGEAATVTVVETTEPGQGGLRLDGGASAALAPGTVVEVTWREPPRSSVPAGTTPDPLPYRVTAAGLPLDVVLALIDSLVPVPAEREPATTRPPVPAGGTA